MKLTLTRILSILLLLSSISSAWALNFFENARSAAAMNAESLQVVRRDIDDLRASRGNFSLNPADQADLTRRVRTAAASAKVSDQLLSIESGQVSSQVSGQEAPDARGGASHAPVYLRFAAVTLEQMIRFLSEVSASPDDATVMLIDLSAPQSADATARQGPENWTAEITLSQIVPNPSAVNP